MESAINDMQSFRSQNQLPIAASLHSNDLIRIFLLSQQNRCLYVVLMMTIFWCSEALPLRK